MNTSTKWCNTLQEYRPLEDFHYDSYSDDGRQPNCKDAKRDILNPKSNPDRMFVGESMSLRLTLSTAPATTMTGTM